MVTATIFRWLRTPVSWIAQAVCTPLVWAFNKRGLGELAAPAFNRGGWHLFKQHYYGPVPSPSEMSDPLLSEVSTLPGVDADPDRAISLLRDELLPFVEEFRRRCPLHAYEARDGFHLFNGSYMAGDAHVYWAMIRRFKPKRIVEIGAGMSTRLAVQACRLNQQETGSAPRLTAIEPYPDADIASGLGGGLELIRQGVQEVPLERFTSLTAGDILFIDSTHALRPGGDVHREYLEILPRLAPGVIVHVHDVHLPHAYPRSYFQQHWYWNEQYLLQAFLAFNRRFEVLWPGALVLARRGPELNSLIPEIQLMRRHYPEAEPSAFWMRVRDHGDESR